MPDSNSPNSTTALTREIGNWIASFDGSELGAIPIRWAKHCLLDWLGVTLAGTKDPLVDILVDDAIFSGETGQAPILGRDTRTTQSFAAMINGAASHALDYDDVNKRLHGHPTVPVLPALLAVAEQNGASGRDLLEAFCVGYEVECLIGEMMGLAHYDHGWHATATVGTFGAAAGASRLLGLDANQASMAIGIAGTQAAGLKSMFGTMCKPLHAGKAAMNGLMAARWAGRGFTSRNDVLECLQGFGLTQSTEFTPLSIRPVAKALYAVEQNLFKYHAACYLIHSSIEAANSLRDKYEFTPADIETISTHVAPGHRSVCDIPEPKTGLEVKFSIRHCIAMALSGLDTSDDNAYTDEIASRDDLKALRRKVDVDATALDNRYAAKLNIKLMNGLELSTTADVGLPATDLDAQEARLVDKFTRLPTPVIGQGRAVTAVNLVRDLENQDNIVTLIKAVE